MVLRIDVEKDLDPTDPQLVYICNPIIDEETEPSEWLELEHGIGAVMVSRNPETGDQKCSRLTVIELTSVLVEWAIKAQDQPLPNPDQNPYLLTGNELARTVAARGGQVWS
jgi:hypothetical protein